MTLTAPVLLAHKERIDVKSLIDTRQYSFSAEFGDLAIYVFQDEQCNSIIELFGVIDKLYVADGHHRLYATSITKYKNSVLSCLIGFDYLDILPIHRVVPNIDAHQYENAKKFMSDKFEVYPNASSPQAGQVRLHYRGDDLLVNLIQLNGDAFWNNDVYRLNTQIISQAFRIFDTSTLTYVPDPEFDEYMLHLGRNEVFIEMHHGGINEFLEYNNSDVILPPKSTYFVPKFPSFLIFKKYK